MLRVAVVAHAGNSFGGGLGELRKVLAREGLADLPWYEVRKSRKSPKYAPCVGAYARCLAHHFLRVPRHRDRLSQPTRVKVTVRFLRQHPRQGRRIVRLDGTLMASTDWQAAITALKAGELPSSSGERRMLLLAASIAGGIPVSLYDTLPGIHRNASLVIKAIAHASSEAC